MGKLLCDSTTVAAETFQTASPTVSWRDPSPTVDLVDQSADVTASTTSIGVAAWEEVIGLEEQQRRHLERLHSKGVLWKHPEDQSRSIVFKLSHGGEVSADGNCLFTASQKAMTVRDVDARELRRRTVRRFLEDLGSVGEGQREMINDAIRHMYSPDLKNGWGIHVVQEVKLLAKKEDRVGLDSAIDELVQLGMQRYYFIFIFLQKNRNIIFSLHASWSVFWVRYGAYAVCLFDRKILEKEVTVKLIFYFWGFINLFSPVILNGLIINIYF